MASAAPAIRLPLQTGQWAAASFTNDVIGTFWHMDSACQETCGPNGAHTHRGSNQI